MIQKVTNEKRVDENNIKLSGEVDWILRDKEGTIIETRHEKNLIVNAGKAEVAAIIGGVAGGAAFSYIAIGIGTTAAAAGDTALESEIVTGGGERANSTESVVETYKTQFVNTFTFTASFAVTESGIFNAASSGDMLARQVFSAINVTSGMTLQCTWKITIG